MFHTSTPQFDTLAPLPSNVEAIESAMLFARGLLSYVAIVGPSGWGKTHLLEATSQKLGETFGRIPPVLGAPDWVASATRATSVEPLLLDNVQDAVKQPRARQALRIELERRIASGKPTMLSFTYEQFPARFRAQLPAARSWCIHRIQAPSCVERVIVVKHIAAVEGVQISPVLARVLGHRLGGNGRTVQGALHRLRLVGDNWTEVPAVLRALGILNPFFAAESSWDLREHVHEVAAQAGTIGSRFGATDLGAYVMLKAAHLPEDQVALFYAITPAEAYSRATALERQMGTNTWTRAFVDGLVERIVNGLVTG
ncbi:MAG: hypothetical protein KIS66_08125 [Fimbriimonadaceae bacterium]|nr:hypothetical protein [Fimbriimonadaceae bacterium]